jgi:hypothetical protein
MSIDLQHRFQCTGALYGQIVASEKSGEFDKEIWLTLDPELKINWTSGLF